MSVRVAVGSTNPAKVEPVREAVERHFPGAVVVPVDVPSGVADQPMTEHETLRGAMERARAALVAARADYGVGIEGGILPVGGVWFGGSWAAVVSRDGTTGLGASARFQVPAAVEAAMRAGREMGSVVDALAGEAGTARKDGAMGMLTRGAVTRRSATLQALHFAFARFTAEARLWEE
jgi:inosine/xanthosine triphosphatase